MNYEFNEEEIGAILAGLYELRKMHNNNVEESSYFTSEARIAQLQKDLDRIDNLIKKIKTN